MPISLDELLNLPPEVDEDHLRRMNLLPQPLPAPSIIPEGNAPVKVAPLSPVTVTADAMPKEATREPQPKLQPLTPQVSPDAVAPMKPPTYLESPQSSMMGFPSREGARRAGQDLSAPVSAGPTLPTTESGREQVELDRLRDEGKHPWGTPENHPGFFGKLGHILARAGNIAGDIVAPSTMALIPGTDLNRQVREGGLESIIGREQERERLAASEKSEEGLRTAEQKNLESETREREGKNDQSLVTDAQGNVTGWKDKKGLHSLDAPETPQSIKDIAADTANKLLPKYEKMDNGDIVALTTDDDGKTKSEVVYHGDPKVESDLVHGHMVNGVPHTLLVNKRSGETIKDLGAEKMPSAVAAEEHGIEVVRAYDKDGKPHLLSKDDAKALGYTNVTKASDADVDKARTHTAILNDMQAKLNDVVASRKALDQDAAQRAIIARALSDKKNTTIGQLFDAGVLAGSTPQTQEYIQSVISLRESGLALPKELTGGSRVTEIQSSALWSTLPSGASLNGDYALNQSKKFQANIDRLRERADLVKGMELTEPHPEVATHKTGGGANPPQGKTTVYDPQGAPHFVLTDKLQDFLKDPKYKGWSKNAPSTNANPGR